MTAGREQPGTRRQGWLHRRHHASSAPPVETGSAPDHEHSADDPEGADGGRPSAPDPPASLDQVLRHADEARKAEGGRPD